MHTLIAQFVFLLFILAYVFYSFYGKNSAKTANNYWLGGRNITVFPLVATLVTSQYGWINGVFETYFSYGPAAWLVLSLPYLIINFLWIKLSLYLRKNPIKVENTPQLMEHHYGKKVAFLSSIFYVWAFLPFMYIKMGADLLEGILQIPSILALVGFAFISAIAYFKGGFKNLLKQDIWMFFAMFIGLIIICVSLPFTHFSCLHSSTTYSTFTADTYILWILLALIVFIDPAVHQRIWAAQSTPIIKKSFGFALLFWILFDLLVIGIVVQVHQISPSAANMSDLFNYLQDWQKLILAILSFAVIVSTANTYFFVAANTFNQYLLKKESKKTRNWSGAFILIILCCILYFFYESKSVLSILFDFYPVVICALFLPVMCSILPVPKLKPLPTLVQMVGSSLVCVFMQVQSIKIRIFDHSTAIVSGLLTSALFHLAFYLYNYVISKKKR